MPSGGQLSLTWPLQQRRNKAVKLRKKYTRCAKYGAGVIVGAAVLRWVKRKACNIPFVGLLASPILFFVPATLLGAGAGAAVVYGVEQGDMWAAKKKLLPKVQRHIDAAHRQVSAVAADLQADVKDLTRRHAASTKQLHRQGHDAANRLLLGIETAARDAERTVVPALERELRRGHHELQRALAQYKQSAGSTTTTGHPGASSSHLVHQPAGSQQRATSGLLDSSE
eukprot:jgi/Chrzof1/5960/Cz16g21300.t1